MSSSSSALSLSPYIPAITNVNPSHGFALAGHTKFTLKDVMGKYNVHVYMYNVHVHCTCALYSTCTVPDFIKFTYYNAL